MNGVVQLGPIDLLPMISNPPLQRDATPASRLRAPELARWATRMKDFAIGLILILVAGGVCADEMPLCLTCIEADIQCGSACFGKGRPPEYCVKSCEANYEYCKSHCVEKKPLQDAQVPNSLLGRYEGWSRACEGNDFMLSEKLVTIGGCEQRFQLLEADEQHVVINVLASDKCGLPKVIKFEMERPGPSGLTFGGYVLWWGKTQSEVGSRCNYGLSNTQ
jgi:hypothetical protein